jgi:hypothetical protein
MAVIDQGRVLTQQQEQPLNGPTQTLPMLYALAGTSAFNTITSATDGTIFSTAFQTSGYNPWTGLGSPVASVLTADLDGGEDTISGTVTLTPASPSGSLAGYVVFLDAAGTGVYEPGDAKTTTDAEGQYRFMAAPGNYLVRLEVPQDDHQTSGNPDLITFDIGENRTAAGIDFALQALASPTSSAIMTTTPSPTSTLTPSQTVPNAALVITATASSQPVIPIAAAGATSPSAAVVFQRVAPDDSRHRGHTQVRVTFKQPVDPALAADKSFYRVSEHTSGKSNRTIHVRSVQYDVASQTALLTLAGPPVEGPLSVSLSLPERSRSV